MGTLEADNLVTEDGLAQYASFKSMTLYAQTLDKSEGWDFRWLTVSTYVNIADDGTNSVSETYIFPKSGGSRTDPEDRSPFYWNTQSEWPDEEVHVEGTDSNYLETFAYPLQLDSDEYLLKEVYLVLYNPDVQNTMLLLQKGKYYYVISVSDSSTPMYSGASVVSDSADWGNTESVALRLEDLLKNSGFGTWDVIPTCPTCGFSFSFVQ